MNIVNMTHTIPESNYAPNVIITPRGICLHITADNNKGQALRWFQNPQSGVSSHYIIEPDGEIILCVYPNMKAYHAGIRNRPTSELVIEMGDKNPNNYLIGIEVVSDGRDINDAQMESLKELILELCSTYAIPLTRKYIIGHYESDRKRRPFDPVWSYHPKQVIDNILYDRKIDSLKLKNDILTMENTSLKEGFEYQTGVIEKVRKQYRNLKDIYTRMVREKWSNKKE